MSFVICSCCGALIEDRPETNTEHGTGRHDEGYGMCVNCGGQPAGTWEEASQMSEADFKKAQGSALAGFMATRIPRLHDRLNPDNQAKFAALPYWRQCQIIENMVEQGLIS